MELLAEYGPTLPSSMQGLADEQINELKLSDEWTEAHLAEDSYSINKDITGRRSGKQPSEKLQDVIRKTIAEAKGIISEEQIKSGVCLGKQHIYDAIAILRGGVTIAYPMNLPSYDPIRMEFENRENLSGTQQQKMVLMPGNTKLWFAGKDLHPDDKLSKYMGVNEKSKIIVKLQHKNDGPPGREPLLSDDERKKLMIAEYKKREELKKLEENDDDSYLNSKWADNHELKKTFQGIQNIKWNPR